ncbi:hypothetical protein GCM10023149_34170 [Mucilaginibacter gynuensis]|uniref:Uncharacterized protein n=1 Tax=Mucilaginibacter gynuensis TaxID=1302236 RepID=A0ABP8GSW9_9SPHI
MKKPIALFLAAGLTITQFTNCGKSGGPDDGGGSTSIDIIVKDADSWSSVNTSLSNVGGATVKLYDSQQAVTTDKPVYTATADDAGHVVIPVEYKSQYFIKASKGNLSNIYEGYVIFGVFINATEVAAAGIQPTPAIGWPKVADINGDGSITEADKTTADVIVPLKDNRLKKTIYVAKPVAGQKMVTLSNPEYPVTKASLQHPDQCFGSIVSDFTCPEKFYDTAKGLLFVDDSKVLRYINGVLLVKGVGNVFDITGKINAGIATVEGKTLTYTNIVLKNGVVTGKVAAIIEPGSCSDEPDYKLSYVYDLTIALGYTSLNNVIHAAAGSPFTEGTNRTSVAQ